MTDRSMLEQHQDQQRADAGRRQAGNDGDRVDEALVEDAEHHIGGEDRRQHQDALALQRVLEHLRRALEAGRDRAPASCDLALDLLDRVDRLAEREARREVERDRHRRLLALVVDLQRSDRRHDPGHRRERHDGPVKRTDAADAAAGCGSGRARSATIRRRSD